MLRTGTLLNPITTMDMNKKSRKVTLPVFFLFFLTVTGAFSSCSNYSDDKSALASGVVAVVNREKIYKEDYEWELEHFIARYKMSKTASGRNERTPKDIVLEQLIRNKLFDQEIRRLSITVSVKELDDEIRLITGEYTPDEFSKKLQGKEISFGKWKKEIRRNFLIRKLSEREVLKKIPVSEKEMEDYYQKNQDFFSLPKRVETYHIVVSDESEAQNIYEDLHSGVDFSEKAKQHSMGIESDSGGRMGVFSPGQLPEEFDKIIFSLKEGQFGDIIKTPYGYHIFKAIKIHKAKKMTFNESKGKIRKIIVKEKEGAAFIRWMNKLQDKSKIVINENYFIIIEKSEKSV